MIRYGFPPKYGDYNPSALTNPDVGVMIVQLDWSDIEPQPGVFDFAKADAEVGAAIADGKKVALVLRFQSGLILSGSSSSCTWDFGSLELMPQWAADDLGPTDSFCSHGTAWVIPKYWSARFMSLWTSCVAAVAAHFAAYAGHIAYVRAPVGLGDEAEPLTGPNSKPTRGDMAAFMRWGFNPQLWEAWQEDMLSYYRSAFWYSPWVLYTINHQVVNNKCDDPAPVVGTFPVRSIPCTGRPVEVDVAEWAIDHGFGLGQNSLDAAWIYINPDKDDPSAGHVNAIFAYAARHHPRPFIELQTFQAQSYFCNLAVPTGLPPCRVNRQAFLDAENDVSYAHLHGVSTIEWYEGDLTNPVLQPVMDLWRQVATMPGHGKLPTAVTVTPDQRSVPAGKRVRVSVTLRAPGITGFVPGGTIVLADAATGHRLKVVHWAPDTRARAVEVRVPSGADGRLNLVASYEDLFKVSGQVMGTYLWASSRSSPARVNITSG